jgi:hypothetical protein
MTAETLSIRVIRVIHDAQKAGRRWLSGKEVSEACPDDNGGLVYSTLSNITKNADNAPLVRRRNSERGGVLEYTTIEGFDFDAWIATKGPKVPRSSSASKTLEEPEVQIVKTILRAKRRLAGDEIYRCGDYSSKEALVLRLADLVKPGGVLERDRKEVGAPWLYGVRRDVDIDAWLKEHGASTDALPATRSVTGLAAFNAQSASEPKTAAPPTGQRVPPQDARTARVAAPKVAPSSERGGTPIVDSPAPTVITSQYGAATPSSPKGPAAGNVAMPQSRPEGALHETPPRSEDSVTESTPGRAGISSDRATGMGAGSPLKAPHAPHREPLDLMTEMAIVSAALLAAEVRAAAIYLTAPALERALRNFERADKLREEAKAGRAA